MRSSVVRSRLSRSVRCPAVRSVDDPADGDRRTGRSRPTTSTRSWLGRWGWGRSLHHRPGLCAGWGSPAPSDRSRGDDPVVAGDGFFDELVNPLGGQPFGAPAAKVFDKLV